MSTWAEETILRYVEGCPWQRGESHDEFIARVAEETDVAPRLVELALEEIERYEDDAY